jgi:hypothetical protein
MYKYVGRVAVCLRGKLGVITRYSSVTGITHGVSVYNSNVKWESKGPRMLSKLESELVLDSWEVCDYLGKGL